MAVTKYTTDLQESAKQQNRPTHEYLIKQLKPIRENFKRLNSIEVWSQMRIVELWESTVVEELKFIITMRI